MTTMSTLILGAEPLVQSPLLSSTSARKALQLKKFRSLNRSGKRPITVWNERREKVVVVGAGIAGLSTALSLHRLGVESLVLEQTESLRTGGASLTLFKNAWRALDVMGVGDYLRGQFLEIQGMVIKSVDGRELRAFTFQEESPGQEVRAVERGLLLETLANELPPDSIRFSSKLRRIRTSETGDVSLELEDGTQLVSQIVIGCDGIRSPIARWMGFSEPRYVGQSAFRGLALYPNGQPFEPKVVYTYGRGLRAGLVPISQTKVYWFICFNSPSPGPKITDPCILKREAEELVRGWNSVLPDVIHRSPDETLSKTPLEDRWLWPILSPGVWTRGVVLAGDAWHPMTPNLGQGACCAIEDAVALAKKVAGAVKSSDGARLEIALEEYGRERWSRVFPLTVRANLVGSLLQWENPVGCAIRDNIVVPKLVRLGPMMEHTNYECERLN